MELKEFVQKKTDLENHLSKIIYAHLQACAEETGYVPDSMYVDIETAKFISATASQHHLVSVGVNLTFDF